MFNYDWFHGDGLRAQMEEAKRRCMRKRLGDGDTPADAENRDVIDQLETRTVLYLKDGLSYEMKELADIGAKSALAFECVPVDENYAVGCYVIVVPFEDIARVEVYAVHPDEKPDDRLKIPGFLSSPEQSR